MFFPIQEDFSAGQISSRLFGKTNSPWYKKGVAYSENWLHLPQGPIRLRAGSQFLVTAFNPVGPIRLIPFNLAVGEDFCLELGPGYARVLNSAGVVQEQGPETVVNGSFTAGVPPWTTANPVPLSSTSYTFNGSTQTAVMNTWTNVPYTIPNGHGGFITHTNLPPGQPSFQQTITGIAAGTYNFSYGFGVGTIVTVNVTDIATSTIVYTNTGSNLTANVPVTIGASGVKIQFEGQAGGVYLQNAVVQGPVSFRATGGGPALITGLPWTAAMLPYIQYAQDVSQGLFLVHPLMQPYQIQYNVTTGAFTAAPVAFIPGFLSAVTHVGTGASVMTVSGTPSQSVNAIVTVTQSATGLGASPPPLIMISLDGGATFLGGQTLGGLIPGFGIPSSGSFLIPGTGITATFTNASFVQGDTYLFTATGPPPADWVTGNYPSAVEIWQSRLWLAGTPDSPATIWASRTFNYYDFTQDAVISEASPFNLTESTKGAIQWIRGKQAMLVGTDLHEDIIISADQVISALDAQLLRESAFGSGDIQAIDLGDQIVYVSRDFTKLRALNFNFDTQAWLAHDLTYNTREITQPGVAAITYQRDPDNTIFSVLTDGTMTMTTYDRLAEALAWSRYTTQGTISSAIVTVDPTGGTLWTAVNRSNGYQIEITPAYNTATVQFLDGYQFPTFVIVTNPGPSYTLNISGLVNLDGQQVTVLAQGTTPGQSFYLVVAGVMVSGTGTLSLTVQTPDIGTVIVGLAYPNVACTTLPLNEGVQFGTAQGQMKRRSRVFVRLVGSTLPTINGSQMAPQRTPQTPMGVVEPPIPFQDVYATQLGWNRYMQVTLGQPLPFATEIDAIFGGAEVSQEE